MELAHELLADGSQPADTPRDSDVVVLRRAWLNEKAAPELLEFKAEEVERLSTLTQDEERKLLSQTRDTEDKMTASLSWINLNRVKYLLRSYLRVRLAKIEEHALHYLQNSQRLSPQEVVFAEGYANALLRHFNASVLDALPQAFNSLVQQIEDPDEGAILDMVPTPNLDGHVFCRVKEDKGDVEIDEEKDVALYANDLIVIRYRPIRQLVLDDSVTLL